MADANGNQTNSLQYPYFNALPGTVAAASSAVGQATETTMDVLNPSMASTKLYLAFQDELDALSPAAAGAAPATDLASAVLQQSDNENVPLGDHSAQLPLAPTSVTAVAGASGHATVNWTAPVDPDGYALTGYVVTASSVTSGAATPVVATVGLVNTLNMAGLTSAKVYTFVVAATNIAGTGAASAPTGNVTIA